jgi:geranylgeranylglycerol-phosphate geranylgeranyltransferase
MGYVAILRPINCLIAFVSVLIGAWIGRSVIFTPQLLLACLVAFIACAFGNLINDLSDIEIDRINNPQRPLVKGTVNETVVIVGAVLFAALALMLSLSLGALSFLTVAVAIALLFLYGMILKRTIAANFLVACVSGLSFVLGGIVASNNLCIIPFIFSFFVHTPREIIKDVLDMQGDEKGGVTSLPIRFGVERSFRASALLLGILCVLLPIPFFLQVLKLRYMLIVLLFAYPVLIYTVIKLLRKPSKRELTTLSTLVKISMAVGLVAMIP